MRIGIYDPYLETLGGGERFVLSIASFLSKSHDVEVFWDDKSILSLAEKKHDLDLGKISITPNIFSKSYSSFKRVQETKKCDIIFYVSDGSIPFLAAGKSYLIFQFPVNWVNGKSIKNRIKLRGASGLICYTEFVKKHLANKFNLPIKVLYPPVDLISSKLSEKENIILTVGRFTKGMNRKKHEVMVRVFKKMVDQGLSGWKFIIAGSYLPEDRGLAESLEKESAGYPIEIHVNITRKKLEEFYKKAKIYWHAAGFGEDLDKHPERAEHFGITTVEAMGAGAVPVVIKAGGQIEIVEDGESGFLWESLEELRDQTKSLMTDERLLAKMAESAKKRAGIFSAENFYQKIEELVK